MARTITLRIARSVLGVAMSRWFQFLAVSVFAALSATASAQQIVVNELYRAGNLTTTDEWVEYVLLQDLTAAQLEGFFFGDSTSATASKLGAFRLTNMATIAPVFSRGTIIVLSGQTGPAEDLTYNPSAGNFNLIFRTNNARVVTVTAGADLAGDDVAWVDTVGTGSTIAAGVGFCVTWDGTPASGALGAACGLTLPFNTNNTGVQFNSFFEEITTVADWSVAVPLGSLTPGQPNGGDNTSAILGLQLPRVTIAAANVIEGNPPGSTPMTFTASIPFSIATDCAFSIETVNAGTANDATAGVDYEAQPGLEVTIPAGQLSATFDINVIRDTLVESNEVFDVATFGEPFACNIASTPNARGTINDDDLAAPTVSINDTTVTEGTGAGATTATFTVTISAAPAANATIDFASAGGAAISGTDFTATTGTLTFTPTGALTQSVNVPITRDAIDEDDETFFVNLSAPVGLSIVDGEGLGTIQDDDTATLSVTNLSQAEGNAGPNNFTFTASLSTPADKARIFAVTTSDGTAIAPGDYTAITLGQNQTITFNPGITTQNFNVSVIGDTLVEADETFNVQLRLPQQPPSPAGNNPIASAIGTIVNDDRELSINNVTVTEGTGPGSTDAVFTVSLSNAPAVGQDVTVNYATAGASATSGTDFTATTGTLTFTSNSALTQTISVPITRDNIDEPNENFSVDLSGAVNATIYDANGAGAITDDDNAPTVTLNNRSLNEGNSGNTNFDFTATLSNPSASQLQYIVYTQNGSAIAPGDYAAINCCAVLATFPPLSTTQTINVNVVGDTTVEGDETFTVALAAAQQPSPNGTPPPLTTGTGTIVNDDVDRELTINDASAIEGTGAGSTNVVFTVSLSAAPAAGQNVTVDYATSSGSALSGTDFTATTGTLTFTSTGALTQTVSVPVARDNIDESDETFAITLSAPANATIYDGNGVGTINDDDDAVLTIANISQVEGNSGTTAFTFTASLSVPSATNLVFGLTTADGTATAPADYQAIASGAQSVTFVAGTTSQTFAVQVVGETLLESDETFTATLTPINTNSPNGSGAATATATIVNDDLPVATIANAQVIEGTGSNSTLAFTVSLSAPAPAPVSVNFATANGSATAPGDFTAASGTVTFAVGQQTRPVNVTVIGDNLVEPDETLQITLSAPTGATLGTATATGTIVNDDSAALSIADVALPEGNGGGNTPFVFTITSSSPSSTPITVNFATSNMSALSPADYAAATGVATIAANATTTTVTVNVVADNILEPNEQFTVTLSAPVGATLADATAIGTIIGDDAQVPIPTLDQRGLLALMLALLAIGALTLRRR